ncbi:probable ribosome production factor 1 [Bacillus rossius redtenbacheri]|uniref:probable ribosome production factor 1 n=1 Tax=Bacillus rossius redtenbacheri TaxID=93214 RepID=UPI002FDD9A41
MGRVVKDVENGGSNVTGNVTQGMESRLNCIKNKRRRREAVKKVLQAKKKLKKDARKQKRKGVEARPRQTPRTLESTREKDPAMVDALGDSESEEYQYLLAHDEFSSYYNKTYEPRVVVTFSDNPHTKVRRFGRELCRIIPNSVCLKRNRASVKKMVQSCTERGYTDVVIINEDRKIPNGLLLIHLPDGPTANFRLSNVKLMAELKRDKEVTAHRPEVILNNFQTQLGTTVSRMLAALFHYDPQFRGRRAATFHNQRDYVFFRHHRYEFTETGKVRLRELGPRFTLKLRSLQKGTFDSKMGEYEWIISGRRHEMETSRRRFFL